MAVLKKTILCSSLNSSFRSGYSSRFTSKTHLGFFKVTFFFNCLLLKNTFLHFQYFLRKLVFIFNYLFSKGLLKESFFYQLPYLVEIFCRVYGKS